MSLTVIANRFTDRNWSWGPFLYLRPSPDKRMSSARVALIALHFGTPLGVVLAICQRWLDPLSQIQPTPWLTVQIVRTVLLVVAAFFFSYWLTFAAAWNVRASELARSEASTRGPMRLLRAMVRVVMTLLGAIAACIACFAYTLTAERPIQERPFDANQWKQAPLYGADHSRQDMLPALLRSHSLIGMQERELMDLLGPQSDPDYFEGWSLRYWLGPERGAMPLDSEWLLLRIEQSRVTTVQLAVD